MLASALANGSTCQRRGGGSKFTCVRQCLNERSQGGVKIPTGGDCEQSHQPASARLPFRKRGQQIRCDSGADGYSPDGRERGDVGPIQLVIAGAGDWPCALILVTTSTRNH